MTSETYRTQWEQVEPQIAAGIEKNRKSDITLRVQDGAGRPLPHARLAIEQTDSAFLFGANLFMLAGYPSPDQNRRYEEAFLDLFNAATIPFYWRDLEPTPGQLRFTADTPFIRRRVQPDTAVAFCKQHHLNINGHCLVWDFIKWSMPDWVPDDPAKSALLIEQRIRQIAERYGSQIERWDVLNEALLTPSRLEKKLSRPMPPDYEMLAFQIAGRYFPAAAHLMINETSWCWTDHCEPYLQQIHDLRSRGARINGIGMQMHNFSEAEMQSIAEGQRFGPRTLLHALDRMGSLNLPIHISEITLNAPGGNAAGEEFQARVATDFYRLWFSHPAVHAITWWNLPDGGAAPGEDNVASGLVNRDFAPKPSYLQLHDLIRNQWRTRCELTTDATGTATLRGFHGRYRIQSGNQASQFDLPPGAPTNVTVRLA